MQQWSAVRRSSRKRARHAVVPACLQSRTHPWLRASVDGICFDNEQLVEIKCGQKVYEHSARHGRVPDYYLGQLQHILAVTGYAAIDFWCYLPDMVPQLIHIVRDDAFIAHMLEVELRFWQNVTAARAG
jgi:putative phage-type endonuclease